MWYFLGVGVALLLALILVNIDVARKAKKKGVKEAEKAGTKAETNVAPAAADEKENVATGLEGESLEADVGRKLKALEKVGAKTIRNCYLRWSNGVTTEIDNILIFRSGIYVFECKDYSGWIYGNSANDEWTQVYRPKSWEHGHAQGHSSSSQRRFYNPIRQNQNHVNCIRQKLKGYPSIPIFNIVVFGDSCILKRIENTTSAHVINVTYLYRTIRSIEQGNHRRLSGIDIERLYNLLTHDASRDKEIRQEHLCNVERVKEQKEFEKNYTGPNCPRCGAALVLKRGKNGSFYGCSRYPQCAYKRKINGFNGQR
jgi:hypothetical protein